MEPTPDASLRVFLAGEEAAGLQVLERLLRDPEIRVAGVASTADLPGRSPWRTAAEAGIPVWSAERVVDPAFAAELAAVDLLLNVHSLHLIDAEVLAAPRIGSFNLHPGPLPECAGLNSASWTLYRGEPEHGVTLHRMDAGIDSGDIAYQTRFAVTERDTALSLNVRCVREGLVLVERLLADAHAGSIPRVVQDRTRRRYFGRRVPNGGFVDWTRPVREVVGFARACDYGPFPSPWGRPRTRLGDRELELAGIQPHDGETKRPPGTAEVAGDAVLVTCGDGRVRVRRIHCDGQPLDARPALPAGSVLTGGAGGA